MDRFTQVNRLVMEAMAAQDTATYYQDGKHSDGVADRITHEIIGLFDPPYQAPMPLEYDLGPARNEACS